MSFVQTTRFFLKKIKYIRRQNAEKFSWHSFSSRSEIIKECENAVDYSKFYQNFCNAYINNLQSLIDIHIIEERMRMDFNKFINKNMVNNYRNDGLVVLLLSKALKYNVNSETKENIEHKQNVLAGVTIATQIALLIHNRLNNNLEGNNKKLLIGDYLFSEINTKLAKIRQNDIYYIMNTALRDMICIKYIETHEKFPGHPKPNIKNINENINFNNLYPISKDREFLGHPKKEWVARKLYRGPILLGRSCECAALAAKLHEISTTAFNLGCHIGLIWEVNKEILEFSNANIFSLTASPVLFGINENPDIYKMIIEEGKDDVRNIDYLKLKKDILKTNAMKKTKFMLKEFAFEASKGFDNLNGDDKFIYILKKLTFTT